MALSKFAEQIIRFQKQHDMTDGEMAFSSHFSVEKIHDFKSGEATPTTDEEKKLREYMNSN
ncbi:LBP_cg2779 family protein [Schleiferilactobacillus shenzhenensis]|uniref:XRE family transcriptional regulator n=1 Tax=Schleiferilactobacillus shenzhenensis LY-73 TaxID=1231336 RepID=U4TR26_9LACO|nr:LBP_cg2779 family protein [Schleiferilactobacillus shenzhenensis]ERL66684.1 hypothetical protein L248_0363 [Schleiferilactobacillus shenzhenensis LY-73]